MSELLAATGLFVLTHVLPALGRPRQALIERFGRREYMVAYSMLSLITLTWLFVAFARAPHVALWDQTIWMRWVPLTLMPLSCMLLVGGLSVHNPLSLTLRSQGFDPARPGILALTRHPIPWALAIWAGAHIPPNGDGAGVIMFSLLLALSLYGPFALDRKRRAFLGVEAWEALAAGNGFSRPSQWALSVVGGLVLYFAILLGHEYVIGVSPLP
ncbi:MAG: NnrU family protein [Rhodospirillales bacterium]|jgi:uncharacterized membrane protein|nr:NnrU family protein [Rhodospirillales bacterium]